MVNNYQVKKNSSPRISRKGGESTRERRYATDEGSWDLNECCSGKFCRSCTAGVIADCVALCCCPCALFNLLTLALVKVPWKMGRKCLGKKKKRKCKKKCTCNCCCSNGNESNGNLSARVRVEEGIMGKISTEQEEEEEIGKFSARFEADQRVWSELYQVGHLGFGRVSFTGT